MMDWTDAYANRAYIPDAEDYPQRWAADAAAFRAEQMAKGCCKVDIAYGPLERNRIDLFMPSTTPVGLIVFVHGGYWIHFEKSFWSHFAQGLVSAGWAVAMPSYTVTPAVRIAAITHEIRDAIITTAGLVDGPIHLAGHSAGGHLVTRMMCQDIHFASDIRSRIKHVISISGLHDLRPLLKTAMNAQLGLDEAEARSESPALLMPHSGASLTCYVGGSERPEFLRQNALLANIWTGLDIKTRVIVQAKSHHFDVLDGMRNANSALTRAILGKDSW